MATELSRRPFMDFAEMRSRFDRFLEELTGGRREDGSWSMAMDVQRTGDTLTLRADVPGIEPDEIKITVEDNVLTVIGEHEEQREEEAEGYLRRERHYGAFRRSMTLPAGAEADHITATTKNGVVEITVPIAEKPTGQKIEITPDKA
ncbi:MAG TPA: Hsp20/alpha crystallin family protein [Baekduia sp.]|nr:Hsp20/alpha crystallin family protein [Baekduia sp.]